MTSYKVMGILNGTPDSFSDGGLFVSPQHALDHTMQMISEGADMIDIGCESSRPGSDRISIQEELDRLLPILEIIRHNTNIPISIDTYKPEVMKAALSFNIDMINDIFALQIPGAVALIKDAAVDVCIMHNLGTPETMHASAPYDDPLQDVCAFLSNRVQYLGEHGIAEERIIIDPGFGFAKTVDDNLALLRGIKQLTQLKLPVLVGLSRKSMFQKLMGGEIPDRLPSCLSATLWCYEQGVQWFRTHDVKATCDALKMSRIIREEQQYHEC
ncbi:MAG: dihydropteroate synthase [Legionellales bacterium]|nr:dihydropteroate synthase [Legionellales bacterium]OUX67777.1 MAG: dihydropteroate synthase [bacterium TMED178]